MKTKLAFFLFFKAILIGLVIQFSGIGLGPDEAQYWTWSQDLSWGYYSKPPGIAWQIWLGTKLFGNTELGVRFGSILLGSLLPFAVYFLAKGAALSDKIAFWSAIIMAFSPIGILATLFAITDVGVVLFWTLALIPIISAIEKNNEPNYISLGCLIAFGALFKWQIYWLWLVLLPLIFLYPNFRRPKFLLGILVSLLGLLPSLYWNMSHEWATFRHVGATFKGADSATNKGNFLEFLGAQAALVSPILFVLILLSFKKILRAKDSLKILGGCTLFFLIAHLTLSLFKKVQGNWCDFAYPSGFVFLTWAFAENFKFLKIGTVFSILLTFLSFTYPTLHKLGLKANPFKHNVGWDNLEPALLKAGYQPDKDFLFASSYQTTSILSFYNSSKKRAYFLNINNIRKNQFSFWPQMSENENHNNGYFIVVETGKNPIDKLKLESSSYVEKLRPFFQTIEELGIYSLSTSNNYPSKVALVFRCINYNAAELIVENQY